MQIFKKESTITTFKNAQYNVPQFLSMHTFSMRTCEKPRKKLANMLAKQAGNLSIAARF
jgi:hypothetical protein